MGSAAASEHDRLVLAGQSSLRVPAAVVCLFTVAIALAYLSMLGSFALAEPDEPRYAEIPREMIASGDWVTPRLNYVKYFEKPPLVYWLTATNFELFGMSEGVARLWPAIFGLVGVGIAGALGWSMFGSWTGGAAAALLATTPLYFGLSQILILDMPLTGLMTVALGAFWFAYSNRRRRRPLVWLLYVAAALGVLTKGPVAPLLIGATIFVFLLLDRNVRALRWVLSPLGIGLFLIIALPWFVLVSHRNPEFVDFFVIKQHVGRFLTPDEHREPLWFFVPIVLGGMLPWTAFVLLTPRLLPGFLKRLATWQVSPATLYCVSWAGVVFIFFSLSGSKLATYILPMFCPLAILTARFFETVVMSGRRDFWRRGTFAMLVFGVVTLVGAAITGIVVDDWRAQELLPTISVGGLLLAGVAVVALGALRRRGPQACFATLLLGMLGVQVVAISGREVAADYRPLGLAIRTQTRPGDEVITYIHYVQAIPFYGRRRTIMVGGRGELDFGSRQGDQRAFFWEKDAQLIDAWRSPGRRVFLIINRVELEPLLPALQPAPRQVAAYGKKVIVTNFEPDERTG
jgi:4-amino-4-deoxy-L-arabinose transferase-like glycosyltransferase